VTRAGIVALTCALVACAPQRLVAPLTYATSARAAERERFRDRAPPLAPVADVNEPVRESTLPNGLRVVLVERHDFPVVAAYLVVDRGALDLDDAGRQKLDEVAYLFGRGGNEQSLEELSAIGTERGVIWWNGHDDDSLWVGARAPSAAFDASLSLLAQSSFGAELSAREYARRGDELRQAAYFTNALLASERLVLFGRGHPYGHRAPPKNLVGFKDAQALHDRLFQPANATLFVVGDVTPVQVDVSATRWLGAPARAQPLAKETTPPPLLDGPRVVVAGGGGLAQTHAAVFARGPETTSEDADAFELLAQVLGGAKSSKLWERLREGAGATYEVAAPLYIRRTATWVSISASYDRDKAVEGVRDVLTAIAALRNGEVTDDEIAIARETLVARWRGAMSTVGGASGLYADGFARGRALARMHEYPSRIERLGRDDLVRVARAYLDPGALRVVFVGDSRGLDVTSLRMGDATELNLWKGSGRDE
jgi:zinc protease